MAKDKAVWALAFGEFGHDFTIYTLMNNMPKYLSDVLRYNLAENALASSLPYLAQWIGGLIFGRITDYLVKKKQINVRRMRRIMTFIGAVIPNFFLAGVGHAGCNSTIVIALFTISLFVKGAFYCGLKINHLDMSVNFAGILMAFMNAAGSLAGFVSSGVINAIAPNNLLEEWIIVWWLLLAVAISFYIVYHFCCTEDRCIWDVPPAEMDNYLKAREEKKAAKQKKIEENKEAKEAKEPIKAAKAEKSA